MEDEFDIPIINKKQDRCKHTCWKCHLCNLHKDNYQTAEQAYVIKLENKITEYEGILTSLGFCFNPHKCQSENGIIIIRKNKIRIE